MLTPVGDAKMIRDTSPSLPAVYSLVRGTGPFTNTRNPRWTGMVLYKRHKAEEKEVIAWMTGKAS